MFAAMIALVAALAPAVSARAAAQTDDVEQLLRRYLPAIAVPRQATQCGKGEPFFPINVDVLFQRDDVILRDGRGRVISTSPTMADLVLSGSSSHLDFPGKALKPGCTYERWFDSLGATPTTYGRVAIDPAHPGQLVAQYWFFWVYNDWNDRHEGDWEMVQFVFDTPSIHAALSSDPTTVMVAQHEGGEVRDWDEIGMWGDSPLVFPAAGSHASYYSANRWLGTDAQSGFGCDDTRTPLQVIEPDLVVLPTSVPSDPTNTFAWLKWEGHWGEKQPSFNNGPTGPATKPQWTAPVTWVEHDGRENSLALPPLGTPVTNMFCAATTRASLAMFELIDRPWLMLLLVFMVVAIIIWSARRTTWRSNDPLPVDAARDTGAMWIAATRLLSVRWRRFLPFVTLLFASGMAVRFLQRFIASAMISSDLSAILDERSVIASLLVTFTWAAITLPVTAFVLSSIVTIVHDEARAGDALPLRSVITQSIKLRTMIHSLTYTVVMLATVLPVYGAFAVLAATRWIVAPTFFPADHPFRASTSLTKGHRLRVLRVGLATFYLAALLGPVLGTFLLATTSWSLAALNFFSASISAVLLPWAMVTMMLARFDLEARRVSRNLIG